MALPTSGITCVVELGVVVAGFAAGVVISVLTAPVGASGAVLMRPVQLDVLRVRPQRRWRPNTARS